MDRKCFIIIQFQLNLTNKQNQLSQNYLNMSIFDQDLNQQQLDSLYNWIDGLPLSRPKKNIARDFSDAAMMAQTINYYYPKLVQLHNYPATNSIKSKLLNWKTLSSKVLSKFGLALRDDQCQKLASSVPMIIQILLNQFKKICGEEHRQKQQTNNNIGKQQFQNRQNWEQDKEENIKDKDNKVRKKQNQLRGLQVTKVQELKQILKILKEKISFVQKNVQRKDAEIRELEDIIQLGL